MDNVIITLLIGALLSAITQFSKRWNISQSHLILLLCVLCGGIWTFTVTLTPEYMLNLWISKAGEVLGYATAIYLVLTKFKKNGPE